MASSLLRTTVPSSTPSISRFTLSSSTSRRSVHRLVKYNYDPLKGHGKFLGKHSLKRVAVDYHQGLLDRLNDQVRGSEIESLTVFDTMLQTAADPAQALTFQYASSAFNNHFFLHGLSSPSDPSTMSWNKGIEYLIRRDFGSTADFALALQDTVRDMPTSGYVWLVQELLGHEHKLALKTTLGSGTILIPARQQGEQSMAFEEEEVMALPELPEERPTGEPGGKNRPDVVEKPWEATPSEEVSTFVPPFSSEFDSGRPSRPDDIPNPSSPLRSTSRSPSTTPSVSSSLSPSPSPPKTDPSGHVWRQIIQPLACLSVHERVYLQDYGFGGKEEYARAWLATVDWNKVWMNTSKRHEKLGWSPIPVKEQEKLKKVTKPKDSYR